MHIQSSNNLYNHHKNDHYLIEHNKQLRCICQLCSCGKHQCPRKAVKTDFETSYARQFKKFQNLIPIEQRPKYRYEERHYSPDIMKTNYQQNFEKQAAYFQPQNIISNSRLELVGKATLAPQVPFVGVSAYADQYQPYQMIKKQQLQNPQVQVLQHYQNNQYKKPVAKFQGISSYKSAYLAPPEPKKPEQKPIYKKPQGQFYGLSSYKDQYKPIQLSSQHPQQKFDYNSYRNFKTVKFEGKSAYKQQFQPYLMQNVIEQNSRILMTNNGCKLNQIVVPSVNYINNKDHVYYDPDMKKFY